MWNYSKTPTRGARSFSIEFDDSLIFDGTMRQAPPPPDAGACEDFVQTVLFTDNQAPRYIAEMWPGEGWSGSLNSLEIHLMIARLRRR